MAACSDQSHGWRQHRGLHSGNTLTVSNASDADIGKYRVLVTNSSGALFSAEANLATVGIEFSPVIQLVGKIGDNYRIDYATSVAPTTWIPLSTNKLGIFAAGLCGQPLAREPGAVLSGGVSALITPSLPSPCYPGGVGFGKGGQGRGCSPLRLSGLASGGGVVRFFGGIQAGRHEPAGT